MKLKTIKISSIPNTSVVGVVTTNLNLTPVVGVVTNNLKLILFSAFIFYSVFAKTLYAQKVEPDRIEDIGLKYYGNITAPDFPKDIEWLNTDKPVSLKDLKGKIVLIDFWTYCCINCIHIIPDLKKLEGKYHNELVVIGVHSAKFLTERGTDNIRQAILRYEIEHPVANDKDFEIWNNYTAKAWPNLVLIDPKGKIIGSSTGEGVYDLFDPLISSMIGEYDKQGGIMNREQLKFALEKDKAPKTLLSFPGKIAADATTSRLFITDSNNNRVLVFKTNDKGDEVIVEQVIGSGKEGNKDGSFTESEFFRPQGIAFSQDKLYIADTENHLIREIDLNTKIVKTIAGLGYQSKEYGFIQGKGLETALNSPWDLIVLNDALYIAMAGPHQLWKMDLKTGDIMTYAGSGRENIIDGAFEDAALAQPSGITTDGLKLYFADSEVSAVRTADLKSNGKIHTIVGQGLFEFGDIDGTGDRVRLQHPLGIVYNPNDMLLYVADTYNSKIKVIDPKTRESKTYSGTGLAGSRDGISEAQFNEPSGLTIVNGKIYVTDTNNGLLRVVDMNTKEVRTVKITNPDMLGKSMMSNKKQKKVEPVKLEAMDLKSGDVKLKFNFNLPQGFHINPDAMPQVSVSSEGNIVEVVETEVNTKNPMFEVPIKLTGNNGKIEVEVIVYYCNTETEGVCKFKDIYFEIPVNSVSSGKDAVSLDYTLN